MKIVKEQIRDQHYHQAWGTIYTWVGDQIHNQVINQVYNQICHQVYIQVRNQINKHENS